MNISGTIMYSITTLYPSYHAIIYGYITYIIHGDIRHSISGNIRCIIYADMIHIISGDILHIISAYNRCLLLWVITNKGKPASDLARPSHKISSKYQNSTFYQHSTFCLSVERLFSWLSGLGILKSIFSINYYTKLCVTQ